LIIFFFFKARFTGIAIAMAKKLNVEKRKIGRKLVWGISILHTSLELLTVLFFTAKGQSTVHLSETEKASAGHVAITGNFIRGSNEVLKLNLPSGNMVTERDNIFIY
jgi:hypothetical protein